MSRERRFNGHLTLSACDHGAATEHPVPGGTLGTRDFPRARVLRGRLLNIVDGRREGLSPASGQEPERQRERPGDG